MPPTILGENNMSAINHAAIARELVLHTLGVLAVEDLTDFFPDVDSSTLRKNNEHYYWNDATGLCGNSKSMASLGKEDYDQVWREAFKLCPVPEADDWSCLGDYIKEQDVDGFLSYAEWLTDSRLRDRDANMTLITPKRNKASNNNLLTILKFCQPYLPATWVGWVMSDTELLDYLEKRGLFNQERKLAPWADHTALFAEYPDQVYQHEREVTYEGEVFIRHMTSTKKGGLIDSKGNAYHVSTWYYTKKTA